MRVRHVILTDAFAGSEQHVCVLANAQARHGHDVEVWGGAAREMRRRLDPTIFHREVSTVRASVTRASWRAPTDLLHAHMTKAEMAATVLSLDGGVPIVATRHFAAVRGKSFGGHLARPFLRHRISAQIAVSQFVAENIDGPSRVVYAGVEPQPLRPVGSDKVVLVAQRLAPEKRTADAVDAFSSSGLAQIGWRLDIAGVGMQDADLRRAIQAKGLGDHVRLLGFRDDLPTRMANAGMLLATAPAEPFGLTVVEAMAVGTPVVATAAGGHLESVGRARADYLYDVGAVAQAGECLRHLAADDAARGDYGAELRGVQQEFFTPDRQYTDTQALYEEVLSR